MINYIHLLRKISNFGVASFLDKVNIPAESFLEMVGNDEGFTIEQINRICDVLSIKDPKEINKNFFYHTVEKNTTNNKART